MGAIYIIQNTCKNAAYVGSTKQRFHTTRWSQHRKQLRAGCHHSRFLQRAWDKYGESSFKFIKVADVSDDKTIQLEQAYLDWRKAILPRAATYNVSWVAGSISGVKMLAAVKTAQSRQRMGRHRSSESIVRQQQTRIDRYGLHAKLQAPDGTIYDDVRSIRAFAREHGLQCTSLGMVLRGKLHQTKGWQLPSDSLACKHYSLVGPDGTVYRNIAPLKKFCIERGLPYKQVHKLFTRNRVCVQGWRAP